jgi:hypothetical protein
MMRRLPLPATTMEYRMLEDLEFIIGDKARLSGKAILYTTNISGSENPFNPRHPALAVAADPSDLVEILSSLIPLPDEMRKVLHDKIKETSEFWSRFMFGQKMYQVVRDSMDQSLDSLNLPEELKRQIEEEMASIPDEETGVPYHGSFVPLVGFDPDAIEPYRELADLARAPDVPNVSYAGLVLTGHAQHYLASYLLDQDRDAGEVLPEGESTAPNFQDIPRDEFLGILEKKISELMYAQETNGDTAPNLRDLVKLTSGTFFVRDALNLSRVAQSDHPGKIELMELYIRRIRLLAEERYEEIPALDRRLQELDREEQA